ncbi:MAG: four helix bundle protein [Crocinitomicaceae bacterium]|nr:four helix bundle protein [Crocinitomicaceae bacterium]
MKTDQIRVKSTSSNLKDRTKNFGITVLRYISGLPYRQPYAAIINQLSRCSTSVGANYRASQRAKSTADFVYKLKIVEEECDETIYFLEILMELKPDEVKHISPIKKEGEEILAIIVKSIKTAKSKIS